MIITLSGVSGSGKSTIAKRLQELLKYNYYSMGKLQREIAKEKGVSILELGELEKKDDSIDRMIDAKQKALGEKEDNFIMDSWLGSHFIPHSYKILLTCRTEVRAERIMKSGRGKVESYETFKEAAEKIEKRDLVNRERWLEYYGYDYLDKRNYNLVIDTSDITPDQIMVIIERNLKKKGITPS